MPSRATRAVSWWRVGAAVARRPTLWITAVRQARRMIPSTWWRRWPFVPVPDGAYLRFRLLTQYGSPQHPMDPGDVVNYLAWCTRAGRVEREGGQMIAAPIKRGAPARRDR